MAEISSLEKRADVARNEQIIRSDYNEDNQYSETHPDALADGDSRGKGTGSAGHGDWLPDPNAPANLFNYSNFDTSIESNPGNDVDNEMRNKAMVKSLYDPTHPYGDIAITSREGQYFVP